jgi:ribulose-5-phosphate 4-epimerase/fuculose-1-phosphate aldolase
MSTIRERVSEAEWKVRVDLAAAYRLVADFGWTDLVFTHISARVPGPDHHFLINPYGMLFEEITASSLVKIDLNANIVLDTGYPVNPAGFTIHSAIHEAREDAKAVLHLHTPDGTAVSTLEQGLLPLNQTAQLVIGDLAYHDYEGVAFDHAEKPRLVADLGTKNVMLLRNHGTLTVGNTVVISAASGAVGSVAGQLAKKAGCRAIGIAGGPEKCGYVVDALKLDACIDYRHEDVGAALDRAAPNGIDGYFENVGGPILNAVLPRMNAFGRIALCGLIAGYEGRPIPIENPSWLLLSRLKMQGFIISEHPEIWPQALRDLGTRFAAGDLVHRESIVHGIEGAPAAMIGLLKGENFGKQLVKLI